MKRKCILATLVFVLVIFACNAFTVSADAPLITLDLELDKDVYCIGDTVVASVSISQISDTMLDKKIGGFQLHLAFDTDVLEYKSGVIKLDGTSSTGVYGYNPGSTEGAVGNIVALYIADETGYTLTTPEADGTLILTLEFEVIGSAAEAKPFVSFSDEQITPDCGYSSFMFTDKNNGFSEIQCSFDNEAVSALAGEYIMYAPMAQYDANTNMISASVSVILPSDCPGHLIAALYNEENESAPVFLKAKTVAVSGIETKSIEFEDITGFGNFKVKYYLFEGFSTISPLTYSAETTCVLQE